MRQQQVVMVAVSKALKSSSTGTKTVTKAEGQTIDEQDEQIDTILYEKLRQLRKQQAEAQSVPPYVIFHDATLRLMAQQQPTSLAEFGKLSGIGDRKRSQYGEIFIQLIQAHQQDYPAPPTPLPPPQSSNSVSGTVLESLTLFQLGLDIEQIALQRGLKPPTIWTHLTQALQSKQLCEPTAIDRVMSPASQAAIHQAIEIVGTESLRDIFDHLQGEYTYGEIRFVLALQSLPSEEVRSQ
jgi:ATP-dependent DNA helicase RecQ